MFWTMHTGIIAAIATIFARYVAFFVPMSDVGLRLTAVAIILVLSGVNILGVRYGGLIQNTFTTAKVAAIVVIIVAGLMWTGSAAPAAAPAGTRGTA